MEPRGPATSLEPLRRRAPLALLAATAAALAAAGCGAAGGADKAGGTEKAKPVVLTMANGNGITTELDAYAAAVRRVSGGTVRIAFRNDWRLGSKGFEPGTIRDVAAGRVDLAWVGSRAFDSVGVSSFDALIAPLLVDSYALEAKVVGDRSLVAPMLAGLKGIGVVGLGVLPGPMRKPLGVTPLVGPLDYRGRTIALVRSAVGAMALDALGASPVEIGRRGPIDGYDGAEAQLTSIDSNLFDKTAPFLTANVNLWPRPLVLFASPHALARLSAGQRKALTEAARVAAPATLAAQRDDERAAAGNICRRGRTFLTATADDVAALRRAVQPVYDVLDRNAGTRAAIARIAAMRGGLAGARQAEAPVCSDSSSAGTSASARTPVDGVWRMTSAATDFHPPAGPANYGTWTYVFDRGHFAVTQRNAQACTWGYGTYTVHGSRMAWTFADGGGFSPDHATNKPGEHFEFGWSRFHDRLTVTPVRGQISPDNFRIHPWRAVSVTPARRSLDSRCAPPAAALPGVP